MLKILHRIVVVLLALSSVLAICCWLEIWNPLVAGGTIFVGTNPAFELDGTDVPFACSLITKSDTATILLSWPLGRMADPNLLTNPSYETGWCYMEMPSLLDNPPPSRTSFAGLYVTTSYWLLALLTAAFPIIVVIRNRAGRHYLEANSNPCEQCDYNLTDNQSGICPSAVPQSMGRKTLLK